MALGLDVPDAYVSSPSEADEPGALCTLCSYASDSEPCTHESPPRKVSLDSKMLLAWGSKSSGQVAGEHARAALNKVASQSASPGQSPFLRGVKSVQTIICQTLD